MIETWIKTCVMVTRRCNLNCNVCGVIRKQVGQELTTEEWFEVFKILKEYGNGFVILFGGEPSLREDLFDLIRYLNKLKLPHTIITNAVKFVKDEDYYLELVKSRPYGVTTSVNYISEIGYKDGKTSYGVELLLKLKKDIPNCDLVANVVVMRTNLSQLPEITKFFTKRGIYSIFTFVHLSDKKYESYWWYRSTINEFNKTLLFTEKDKPELKKIADFFLKNYTSLLLHNSRTYFEMWKTDYPIKLNWKCKYFTYPNINPDGTIMACVDRPLPTPINILDLPEKEEKLIQAFKDVVKWCPGCFWDHMFDTNLVVERKMVKEGKLIFAHKRGWES